MSLNPEQAGGGRDEGQGVGHQRQGALPDLKQESFSTWAWNTASNALFALAKLSGVVATTVGDMRDGLEYGGRLQLRREFDRVEDGVTMRHLQNDLVSCVFRTSRVEHEGARELRESIDIVRRDLPGGIILQYTDGVLVSGYTNGVPRVWFHPDEVEIAEGLLKAALAALGEE